MEWVQIVISILTSASAIFIIAKEVNTPYSTSSDYDRKHGLFILSMFYVISFIFNFVSVLVLLMYPDPHIKYKDTLLLIDFTCAANIFLGLIFSVFYVPRGIRKIIPFILSMLRSFR
jgi:hypothetical protein